MTSSVTPSDLAKRRPSSFGPITEGHESRLRRFAFFPYRGDKDKWLPAQELSARAWDETLQSLADLAEPEDWTGSEPNERLLPILDNYLRYTHQRLVMEDKIAVSADGDYAASNTGLLTPFAEQVFGLFRRNNREHAQLWVFQRWATESAREILRGFPETPEMAEYVSAASDLVYDWRREAQAGIFTHTGREHSPLPTGACLPAAARQTGPGRCN